MTAQILLPESRLVQPAVVPMHVLRDPDRERTPSIVATARLAKTISTYAALPNCTKQRMLAVSMNPPDAVGMRHPPVTSWRQETAGTGRGAPRGRTPTARCARRSCRSWESPAGTSAHGSGPTARRRGAGDHREGQRRRGDHHHAAGQDRSSPSCGGVGSCSDAAPEFLQPLADNYGWQEISLQVDRATSSSRGWTPPARSM